MAVLRRRAQRSKAKRTLIRQHRVCGALAEAFRAHPDYQIITSFPGLADISGAIVLAEIGDDRNRFADDRCLQAFAGSAPITRASGQVPPRDATTNQEQPTRRHRLLLGLHRSRSRSSLTRDHYLRRRDLGDGHPAALR